MPTVFVPPLMQKLTDGKPTVPVQGKSVREVIDNLDRAYPGVKARLVDGFKLKPNISVAVDGEVSPIGMLQRVEEDSEVHFLPAIGGGSRDERMPRIFYVHRNETKAQVGTTPPVIPAKAGIQQSVSDAHPRGYLRRDKPYRT